MSKLKGTKPTEPDIVIAIDPSSGAKSAVGVSIINPKSRSILNFTEIICPKYMAVESRIKLINKSLKSFLYPKYVSGNILIAIEYTIMAGKGGESLNRAIGAIIAATPVDLEGAIFRNVQNTTVKKLVAGTGKAEKEEVAVGLLNFFGDNKEAVQVIKDLTSLSKWDILDSLAIGVTGYLQLLMGEAEPGDDKKIYKSKKEKG